MALVSGLHHASLKCVNENEFKRAVDFYKQVLKIAPVRQWEQGIMFDTGCGIIEIFNNGKEKRQKGIIEHFAFKTDCVDDCVNAVKGAGYQITRGPVDIDIPTVPVYPVRVAFCIGPLGEEIEFFQERKA